MNGRLVPISPVTLAMVEFGTESVRTLVLVPTDVLPENVSQVIVPVLLVALVICAIRLTGGVHETDVSLVFVTIVPDALPNE